MPTKEELLEAKVEVLEHNLATLIAMVTDLAARASIHLGLSLSLPMR